MLVEKLLYFGTNPNSLKLLYFGTDQGVSTYFKTTFEGSILLN